jgi:hypothetical protein
VEDRFKKLVQDPTVDGITKRLTSLFARVYKEVSPTMPAPLSQVSLDDLTFEFDDFRHMVFRAYMTTDRDTVIRRAVSMSDKDGFGRSYDGPYLQLVDDKTGISIIVIPDDVERERFLRNTATGWLRED